MSTHRCRPALGLLVGGVIDRAVVCADCDSSWVVFEASMEVSADAGGRGGIRSAYLLD